MIQLGFAIQKTHAGVQPPITIHGGNWDRSIGDVRGLFQFAPDNEEITFVRVLKTGLLLYDVTLSNLRGGDNTARVLYVPADADITGATILDIFNSVRKNESMEDIKAILENGYPQKASYDVVPTDTQGKRCAKYITTTDEQLAEYLERATCQSFNADYNAIFINIAPIEKIAADELSPASLRMPITMMPPGAEAIRKQWGKERVALYVNGRELTGPIRCFRGEPIKVTARLQGCLPLEFSVKPLFDGQEMPVDHTGDFKVRFTPNMVTVQDEHCRRIENPLIQLNNSQVGKNGVDVDYRHAKQCTLRVSAEGYEAQETIINAMQPCTVTLRAKEMAVHGHIELANGKEVKITLSGKGMDLNPQLYGYDNAGNYFIPKAKDKSSKLNLTIIYACLIGVIGVAVGFGGALVWNHFFNKPEETTQNTTGQPSTADIAKYFLEHDTITARELDSIGLSGLFDAMKESTAEDIRTLITPHKAGSNVLSNLHAATANIGKLKEDPERSSFWKTVHGKGVIIVSAYIAFLNDSANWKSDEAPATSNTESAGNTGETAPRNHELTTEQKRGQYLNERGFSYSNSAEMGNLQILQLYKDLSKGNIKSFFSHLNEATRKVEGWNDHASIVSKLQPYRNNDFHAPAPFRSDGTKIDPTSREYIQWLERLKNAQTSTPVVPTPQEEQTEERSPDDI